MTRKWSYANGLVVPDIESLDNDQLLTAFEESANYGSWTIEEIEDRYHEEILDRARKEILKRMN